MNRRYLAEAVGTFCLVFAGTGALIVDSVTQKLGLIGISIVFGAVVGVMVYSLANISGAHINPAITIGFASVDQFPKKEVIPYVLSQLAGATIASLSCLYIFGDLGRKSYLGATLVNPLFGWQAAFAIEVIMTFFLVFVVIATTSHESVPFEVCGLAIGGTVSLDVLLGGPISGASMNPARTFGPSLVSGNFAFHWLYWAAPVLGAVAAALLHEYIKKESV